MTDYIVLRRSTGTSDLKQLGVHTCTGPDVAIREIANGEPGVYVAVPTRSWHERDGAPIVTERFALNEVAAPEVHPGQLVVDDEIPVPA